MRVLDKRSAVFALAFTVALAFHGDTPASEASCCNVAASYTTSLFPGGDGDEGFFGLPIGVPANAMILLDNSGSMRDFPDPLPRPTLATGSGTCSGTWLNDYTASRTDTPYDNGATSLLTDSPPWALANCTEADSCLFKGSSYYVFLNWGTDWAREYRSGSSSGAICEGAPAACQTCLDDVGYYIWKPTRSHYNFLFKGNFLNAYPPKFVIARKVVKDLIAIDSANPDAASSVRFGLSVFTAGDVSDPGDGLYPGDGARLLVPLGPNCDRSLAGFKAADPVQVAAYREARQAIVDAINDPSLVAFESWTPLGESLFNVGQYFSDTRGHTGWPTSGATGPTYDYMFGSRWTRTAFRETAAGEVNASWVSSGRQQSICWDCQQSSTIIVTDGEPTNDNNLPKYLAATNHTTSPTPGTAATSANNDFRRWTLAALTVPCPQGGCPTYYLQRVSHFLFHQDLRPDLAGVQSMVTHAISFGIPEGENAAALLDHTARVVGGGTFKNTSTGEELKNALRSAVSDTIARSTSFSVSNTNTLQTGDSNQLLLARFRKLLGTTWEGHVSRFRLFDEYVQGCDKTKSTADQTPVACKKGDGSTVMINPNLNRDEDCDHNAVCDSIFIIDSECDPVAEDKNGDFRKGTLSAGKFTATTSNTAAYPYWDAGANLSYKVFPPDYPISALRNRTNTAFRSADESARDKRVIYTVVDSDGDGAITADDDRIEFTAANAALLAPYMDLNGKRVVDAKKNLYVNVCATMLERLGFCGAEAPLPACPVPDANGRVPAADVLTCAKQVIYYVRGWDVMDEDHDGCAGPGNPSNATNCPAVGNRSRLDGEERIRGTYTPVDPATGAALDPESWDARPVKEFWKLGDVFHSSPVIVKPPAPEFVCDFGLDTQCASTIHSPSGFPATQQTPAEYDGNGNGKIEVGENAYTIWRKGLSDRQQLALVGANDGMLHAFDAGSAVDGSTASWLGIRPFTLGTGAEVWAFVPPDLLPRLKLAMEEHQYFVDGNTLVRDVWVDGNGNGRKEPTEFHTLAILSERSGGSHRIALDVTNPTDPKLRWVFPASCTLEENLVGQSWDSVPPRHPPIGPVRLAVTRNGANDPTGRGFEERWVVMVNGGYDPTLTRGRGVWMLDVWTGAILWKFTDDDLKSTIGSGANMWSVPASVAMLDVGRVDQSSIQDADGFFDTANWGDLGGTLFTARFHTPGVIGPSGLVTNWSAARSFEEQRQTDGSQIVSARTEFFNMSANTVDLRTGQVRTYLGGGNRDQLLQTGAACGPGNVLGCCQAGCNAEMFTHYNYSSCNVVNHVKCTNGKMTQDRTSATSCEETYACGKLEANVQLHLQCGAAGNPADTIAKLSCDADGTCDDRVSVKHAKPVDASKLTAPTARNRFYGIWSIGSGSRRFDTTAEAVTFDARRLTDISYANSCSGPSGNACTLIDTSYARVAPSGAVTCENGATKCTAGRYDPGWFYEYGRSCPTGTTCPDPLPWNDEKTASGATIMNFESTISSKTIGCTVWNSFRPRGSTGASLENPCSSADTTQARNYTYLAHFSMGVPQPGCGFTYRASGACGADTEVVRAQQRNSIAPPPDPTKQVAIGMDGEVKDHVIQIEPGGSPSGTGSSSSRELLRPSYWLEVDPQLHTCRHVPGSVCR